MSEETVEVEWVASWECPKCGILVDSLEYEAAEDGLTDGYARIVCKEWENDGETLIISELKVCGHEYTINLK